MKLASLIAVRRNRAVWNDPLRRYRTLVSFSETEEDGGKDLSTAARRVSDPQLRMHLERHAKDEVRHAALFRARAAEVKDLAASGAHGADESDRAYDLSRGRPGLELDAHGFFNAGLFDEMGEVAYIAMLHVAECRAAEMFEIQHAAAVGDEETQAVFTEILRDEKYHVSYTGKILDQWRAQGRELEVERALKSARGSRFMSAWKRLGVRSGAGFSQFLLFLTYWTVLLPFGLLTRLTKTKSGWQGEPASGTRAKGLDGSTRSQY